VPGRKGGCAARHPDQQPHGTKADAETLREQIAEVLSMMGLRLSPEKTLITHIEQGLDFLGWHIQRHRKPGTNRYYVYTYPAKKALRAIMAKHDLPPVRAASKDHRQAARAERWVSAEDQYSKLS
jgi:hypothetical protein